MWKQQELWEILEKMKMMEIQNKLPRDFGCDTIKLNGVKEKYNNKNTWSHVFKWPAAS